MSALRKAIEPLLKTKAIALGVIGLVIVAGLVAKAIESLLQVFPR